jgi:succinate dehydrogenase / fumarate reductase cytochrome b subunit
MNSVAILWPAAYNQVCEFLGANWYALIASIGLAVLFIIHIIYACWLTLQNRKARGTDRYAVTARPPQVEWSSKNMLVLGIVVVAFLVVHLIQFWSKMQLQELLHTDLASLSEVNGAPAAPAFGTLFIQLAFQCIWTPIVYIIGFVALWFHMNHGFWSMFHTIGWDNTVWMDRLKKISCYWTSIVVALFIIQAVVFTVRANNNFYTEDPELQEQYGEFWAEKAQATLDDFNAEAQATFSKLQGANPAETQEAQINFFTTVAPKYVERAALIDSCANIQCPNATNAELGQLRQFKNQIESSVRYAESMKGMSPNN